MCVCVREKDNERENEEEGEREREKERKNGHATDTKKLDFGRLKRRQERNKKTKVRKGKEAKIIELRPNAIRVCSNLLNT